MAGTIHSTHKSYEHFNQGVEAKHTGMTTQDKHMLDFAAKVADNPSIKTHGQILRNFGMYPPEFWTQAQNLSGHRDVAPEQKKKLNKIFPEPSRPGPMTGGYDVKLGLEQYP